MKTELTWVSSAGGPLILLPESLLPHWSGSFRASEEGSQSQTDYDRACKVQGYLGVINVNAGQGLVLGDEPMQTSWLPLSEQLGGILIRWQWAPDEKHVNEAMTDLSRIARQPPSLTFGVSDKVLLLFDAACSGNDPGDALRIDLLPGQYSIESTHYEPDEETSLILHRLSRTL
jgi:immunity protein 21 of polymorphic toxin system